MTESACQTRSGTESSAINSMPASDLDFNFFKKKLKLKIYLNDAIASALLFDVKIIKNGDEGEFEEMSILTKVIKDIAK